MTEDSARPLGEWLRQHREELGVSLEEAQETTRIRAHYLEALEAENLEALPNPVVARGFLRNYAAYLELDPQEAVARYSRITGPSEPEPLPVDESNPFDVDSFRPVPLHKMPGPRSRWWIFVGLLVILVVIAGFLAWQGYPYVAAWLPNLRPAAAPEPTQHATSTALNTATHTPTTAVATTAVPLTATPPEATPTQATPTLEVTLSPTFTPSPSPTPTEPVYTGIFLELVFTDTSWIQVTVDGVRQFQGELETGTYRSWYGEERVELRVGNAGAVLVTVNGQNLGPLGDTGNVVDRVFEIVDDQVSEATPTRAPTGAATGEPSATPTVEPASLLITPQSTATETITATPSSTATETITATPSSTATANP